jgi:Glycosyltransferase family 87
VPRGSPISIGGARFTQLDGRVIVVAVLCLYLASVAIGGAAQWRRLHEPAETLTFLDMRSLTSAWTCARRGIDPLPANPCDPHGRPANYPRLWLAPRVLGLGDSSAFTLGIVNGAAFLLAILWLLGRVKRWEGIVMAAALCSPAVMFGIERGNVDLFVYAILAGALVLLRRTRPATRLVSHALFLFAAILKLFPLFALPVLARQSRRWQLASVVVVCLFALDVAVTWHDIETIRRVLPQRIPLSYGVGVLGDGAAHEIGQAGALGMSEHTLERALTAAFLLVGAASAVAIAGFARITAVSRDWTLRSDAFIAGAAIYVGSFALLHNFDYRLACLVLTLPELMARSAAGDPERKAARLGIALVLLSLFVAAQLRSGFPWDEVVNWVLFVYLAAALARLVLAAAPARPKRPAAA